MLFVNDLLMNQESGLVLLFFFLVFATFVSEDFTCISAGVMAAEGRISFLFAVTACLIGIYVGDMLLFFAGRFFGRAVVKRVPLKWFLSKERVERSSLWFERKGVGAIFISRFIPGMRLPTYFAAGLLNTNAFRFALYFFIAAAVWTPLLVGLSLRLGAETVESAFLKHQSVWLKIAAVSVLIFFLVKFLLKLSSYQGRRLLVSHWRRLTRWEFWSPLVFYPPVFLYIIRLSIKYRSLTLFTSVNPAMFGSGFVGESKAEILYAIKSKNFIAQFKLIPSEINHSERIATAHEFMSENSFSFPIVLKPDKGERGAGVAIIKTEKDLEDYLAQNKGETIIQEYIAGKEYGVFYYRYPTSAKGKIFAITDKRFPALTGDGRATLEELILQDDRAVCMAKTYCNLHREKLYNVPANGEQIQLVELGTHCRGAVFLDGGEIKTDALENAIDELSKSYEGFYFGRYDIRTPSLADFKKGKNFKVVELNGVTSEATNIYDPKNSLFTAYKILFEQWRIAFEIGAQNRKRGIEPLPVLGVLRLVIAFALP